MMICIMFELANGADEHTSKTVNTERKTLNTKRKNDNMNQQHRTKTPTKSYKTRK